MDNEQQHLHLMAVIQSGLAIEKRPFLNLARQLQTSEQSILNTLKTWQNNGIIKRMGIIVNHNKLGYSSNAMAVWNIPDENVDAVGEKIKLSGLVSLCYRRRRHRHWPYNLFCMIHGKNRESVEKSLQTLINSCGLNDYPHEVLYTLRQFKQCGGQYARTNTTSEHLPHAQPRRC